MKLNVESELIDYISKYILRIPSTDFNAKTMLLDKGLIDSFGIIELVLFIEKTFKLSLNEEDIHLENFSSVEAIHKMIIEKKWKLILLKNSQAL